MPQCFSRSAHLKGKEPRRLPTSGTETKLYPRQEDRSQEIGTELRLTHVDYSDVTAD